MRMRHAELGRALVHQRGEILLRAADALGERDRRVVARLDDQALQEVVDAHLAVNVQKRRRAVAVAAAGAPGIFGDVELVVEMQPPFLELAEDDLGGHQLDRGGAPGHRLVGALLEQHRAAFEILDEGDRRGGLEALGEGARRGEAKGQNRRNCDD